MTATDLIRQCGNPEYTIRLEDLRNCDLSFDYDPDSPDDFWGLRTIVGELVRIRNQDGAEIDRVRATYYEMELAHRKGAIDGRARTSLSVWFTFFCKENIP